MRSLYSNGPSSCCLTNFQGRRYSPTNCNCAKLEFEIDRLTVENGNCADREFEVDSLDNEKQLLSCSRKQGLVFSRPPAGTLSFHPPLLNSHQFIVINPILARERHVQPRYHHLASSVQHQLANHSCALASKVRHRPASETSSSSNDLRTVITRRSEI